MKEGLPPNKTPISYKRQKILDEAFVEMRKAQKKMNPKFLKMIRDLIKNSPAMIEKLGLKSSEIPQAGKAQVKPKRVVPPLETKEPSVKVEPVAVAEEKSKEKEYEKIDQSKNIDIVSKLMKISPDKKEKIVKMLSDK